MDAFLNGKCRAISAISVTFVSALLIACGSPESSGLSQLGSHANLTDMVSLAGDSYSLDRQLVPEVVLRQVDYYAEGFVFRFTDAAAAKGITIHASTGTSPEQLKVIDGNPKLLGHPSAGLDIAAINVDAESVLELAQNHWSNGDFRSLGLSGAGQDLSWYVFWNLPEGVVSAWVDAVTGEFTPSTAPPAIVPPIATAELG